MNGVARSALTVIPHVSIATKFLNCRSPLLPMRTGTKSLRQTKSLPQTHVVTPLTQNMTVQTPLNTSL